MTGENDSEARGRILVWAGVLIFAATGTVMRCLTGLGAEYPIDGRNAITSCAILLVGNICAFLLASALYARTWTRANLRHLTRQDWLGMGLGSLLSSAIAPALTLIALETTSVTEVVLLGRLEPLLFLILATWLLGVALDRWALAGAALALAGVGLTLLLQADGVPDFGAGQLYAALAAVSLALSSIVSKSRLQRVPFGIFMVFRLGVGTALSLVAVWCRQGAAGFDHIFAPILWQSMVVYGAVFVVGAQVCWFSGLKSARPADVSLAGAFSPVASILFALILLGEEPSPALAAGSALMMVGIVLGRFGARALETLRAAGPRAKAALIQLKHLGVPPRHRRATSRAQERAARSWQPAHGLVAFAVVPGAPPVC